LEVGRHYVNTWLFSLVGLGEEPLSQEGEQSQTIPNLACFSGKRAEKHRELEATEKSTNNSKP
jgi:hypothetical protein